MGDDGGVTRRAFVLSTAGTAMATGALVTPAHAAKKRTPPRRKRAAGPPTFSVKDGNLVGDNGRIEVVIDGTSGGIRSVVNLLTGQHLLAAPGEAPKPWRMAAQNASDDAVNLPGSLKNDAGADDFTPQGFRHTLAPGGQEAL